MKGFTLVEILVVLAVSIVLTASTFILNNSSRSQVALSVEAAKVGETIVQAKDLAVATYFTTTGICGYGVIINPAQNTYSLFVYKPAGGAPPCPPPASINLNTDAISVSPGTWQIPLSREVSFSGAPSDSLSFVIFTPPVPVTTMNRLTGGFTNQTSAVHLVATNGTASTSVVINPAGQISF